MKSLNQYVRDWAMLCMQTAAVNLDQTEKEGKKLK